MSGALGPGWERPESFERPSLGSVGFFIVTLLVKLEEKLIINDVSQSLQKPTEIA